MRHQQLEAGQQSSRIPWSSPSSRHCPSLFSKIIPQTDENRTAETRKFQEEKALSMKDLFNEIDGEENGGPRRAKPPLTSTVKAAEARREILVWPLSRRGEIYSVVMQTTCSTKCSSKIFRESARPDYNSSSKKVGFPILTRKMVTNRFKEIK